MSVSNAISLCKLMGCTFRSLFLSHGDTVTALHAWPWIQRGQVKASMPAMPRHPLRAAGSSPSMPVRSQSDVQWCACRGPLSGQRAVAGRVLRRACTSETATSSGCTKKPSRHRKSSGISLSPPLRERGEGGYRVQGNNRIHPRTQSLAQCLGQFSRCAHRSSDRYPHQWTSPSCQWVADGAQDGERANDHEVWW